MKRFRLLPWLAMLGLAIANGAARDFLYANALGDLAAHQLSCVTGSALFLGFMWLYFRKKPLASGREALGVGLFWLVLTVIFECAMGLAAGKPWAVILADYDIASGRLWVMVLAVVALGPYLIFRAGRKPGLAR